MYSDIAAGLLYLYLCKCGKCILCTAIHSITSITANLTIIFAELEVKRFISNVSDVYVFVQFGEYRYQKLVKGSPRQLHVRFDRGHSGERVSSGLFLKIPPGVNTRRALPLYLETLYFSLQVSDL